MISFHKNATTTPVIRQRMSGSDEPAAVLALRYGVSEETARKWKRRDSVQDLSAIPHNLQTTLTCAQGAVVVQLRRLLLAAARRSSGGDAGVPEPGGLAVGSGSVLAAARCEQSQRLAAQDAC